MRGAWAQKAEETSDTLYTLKPATRTCAGEMVYSTCTLTPEENEENVHWALQALPVELLDAREKASQAPTPHLLSPQP